MLPEAKWKFSNYFLQKYSSLSLIISALPSIQTLQGWWKLAKISDFCYAVFFSIITICIRYAVSFPSLIVWNQAIYLALHAKFVWIICKILKIIAEIVGYIWFISDRTPFIAYLHSSLQDALNRLERYLDG